MTVIIGIVVAIVVIWLISLLFEWISDHKKGVLSLLGVIVLIFLLPRLWPYILSGLQLILSGLQGALDNWPILLIPLACFGVYKYKKRKVTQDFVMWTDRVGIAKKSEVSIKQSILDLAEKDGSIIILRSELILSTKFNNQVCYWLNQPVVVSNEIFYKYCLQFAPDFKPGYSAVLINYFSDIDKLLPLLSSDTISDSNKLYLSSSLKDSYMEIIKKAGAATEDEFTDKCETLDTGSDISPNPRAVAVTILNVMVSKGTVEKVDLKKGGETLFVYKGSNGGTNFVRREICLDD